MAPSQKFTAGRLTFVVRHELWDGNIHDHADQGVSIDVKADVVGKDTTLLRFNCFDFEKSYVYGPQNAELAVAGPEMLGGTALTNLYRMDATVDGNPIGWTVKTLETKLPKMLQRGFVRRLDREIIQSEIATQFSAFRDLFGRAPDFADGPQHAQLFPVVRDAFLAATAANAPGAWVRQGGSSRPLLKRLNSPKALLLDALSRQFRKRAARANIPYNTAFAGAYDFLRKPDFSILMQQFLHGLPEGGLVMCHPGFVDETLESLDPLTTQREREHAYLAGEHFPPLLAANKVRLD